MRKVDVKSLPEYLKRVVAEIVRLNLERKEDATDDDKLKQVLNRMKPDPVPAGFTQISYALACGCGNLITCTASPPEVTDDMVKAIEADPNILALGDTEAPLDARHIASNVGQTTHICDDCGQRHLIAWHIGAVKLNVGVKTPWDAPEVPAHPSSGLIPFPIKGSKTVH